MTRRTTIAELNSGTKADFVLVCGPFFEHSPWIAERTWPRRPFLNRAVLHAELVATLLASTTGEQLSLLRAHPDLVGKLAQAGKLTAESTDEQSAAGLGTLSREEVELFDRYNAQYRDRFGFPFIVCARQNRKDAILALFPPRLVNSPEQEMAAALDEVSKIAGLRLHDALAD